MSDMSFGDCQECGQYNFLQRDRTCSTCLAEQEDNSDWVVVIHVPHMGCHPEVYERDLTEEEAKEKADDDPWLMAKPEDLL